MRGLSPVAASGGHSSSRCAGLSLSRPLVLRGTGSRRAGSVIVAHGPSCSAACGILPDQGSNPCLLHWQADSQPLRHQGSPPSFNPSDLVPTLAQLKRLQSLEVTDHHLPEKHCQPQGDLFSAPQPRKEYWAVSQEKCVALGRSCLLSGPHLYNEVSPHVQ